MKVVLDSSVLIAAAISRTGVCAQLLEDILQQHELVLSRHILDEVERKLVGKFAMPPRLVKSLVRFVRAAAIIVDPASVPATVCRDATELPVFGTAEAAHADCLVTVDKDLLAIDSYEGVRLVRPGKFWALQ